MGFNSVVMICNDAIGAIQKDPDGWWDRTWEALNMIAGRSMSRDEAIEHASGARSFMELQGIYGFGCNANGYQAVWNQHADTTGLIAVGRNCATVLHTSAVEHHSRDGQVSLLREWARKLGYDVVKRTKVSV